MSVDFAALRRRLETPVERFLVVFTVVVPLIATIYAIVLLWEQLVGWRDIAIMLGMYTVTALGITVGFHRMLTHRSFAAHPVVRFLFLMFGSMAMEGPALDWASIHIQHHANSDHDDDPHSPIHGFLHAHLGWFFNGFKSNAEVYGRWLKKDRLVVFMSDTFLVWTVLSYLIPFLLGGWTGLLWGGFVRVFLTTHVTWSVNSICHTFGNRMFETTDRSYNNWVVGLLAFGEGWHNNHHAFPRSAFHGMRWYQFDLSSYVIMGLEKLRLVWDVQRVPEHVLEARLIKAAREMKAASLSQAE
ncbi:acyl-CoA desaturase [Chloroflexia bacterium SDU3-3]|nr:acyl-CoA desaturase [Chloroflexia bacterium SDU3-3]